MGKIRKEDKLYCENGIKECLMEIDFYRKDTLINIEQCNIKRNKILLGKENIKKESDKLYRNEIQSVIDLLKLEINELLQDIKRNDNYILYNNNKIIYYKSVLKQIKKLKR